MAYAKYSINGRLMMPVAVRLNHAIADGYLVAKEFIKGGDGEKIPFTHVRINTMKHPRNTGI